MDLSLSPSGRAKKGGTRFHLVSWEPRDPIGFSPCGIAFGAARRDYSAPGRFFADDPLASNRIRWFEVPDDTPVYEPPTVFTPRIDDIAEVPPAEFEKTGPARTIRKYTDPPMAYFYPHDHVHGNLADFLGQSLRSKYTVADPNNPGGTMQALPMCQKPILFARLGFDARMDDFLAVGVALGVDLVELMPLPTLAIAGLRPDVILAELQPIAYLEPATLGTDVALITPPLLEPWLRAMLGVELNLEIVPPLALEGIAFVGVGVQLVSTSDGVPVLFADLGVDLLMPFVGPLPPPLECAIGVVVYMTALSPDVPEFFAGLDLDAWLDSPADFRPWLDLPLGIGVELIPGEGFPAEEYASLGIKIALTTPLDSLPWLDVRMGIDLWMIEEKPVAPILENLILVQAILTFDPPALPNLITAIGVDAALLLDPQSLPTIVAEIAVVAFLLTDPPALPTLFSTIGVDAALLDAPPPLPTLFSEIGVDAAVLLYPQSLPTLITAIGVQADLQADPTPHVVPVLLAPLGMDAMMDTNILPVLSAEVKLGATLVEGVKVPPTLTAGLKLKSQEYLSLSPGATCLTATTVGMNVTYLLTVPTSGRHWFRWPVQATIQYGVQVTPIGASYPSVTVQSGPDCNGRTTRFNLSNITPCNTFTRPTDTNGWIQLDGSVMGPITYYIQVGYANCPMF